MNNIKRLKATIKETCHQVNIKLCGSILDNIIPNKLNPIFTAEDKRKTM